MKKTIGVYEVSYNKDFDQEIKTWNKIKTYSVLSAICCVALAFIIKYLFSNQLYIILLIMGGICMLPSYYFLKSDLNVLFEIVTAFHEDRIIDIKEEQTNGRGIRKLIFYYEDEYHLKKSNYLICKEKLNTDLSYRHLSLDGKYIEIPYRFKSIK